MNSENYVKLPKENLAIHMHIYKCTIFMHDGALHHRSKSELSDDGKGHNAGVDRKQARYQTDGKYEENLEEKNCR